MAMVVLAKRSDLAFPDSLRLLKSCNRIISLSNLRKMSPIFSSSAHARHHMDKLKRPLSPSFSLHPTFLTDEEPHHSPAATSIPLADWLYWQRDPRRNPHCWTKVFAVLDDAFLWLFQREESAPRSLLVQLAVSGVSEATAVGGGRQLHVCDPNGEQLAISLCDDAAFELWYSRLQDAADLTEVFFRNSGLGLQDLPRSSHYRGTLAAYYRGSRRTRCKRAVNKIAKCWKRHQSSQSPDA